MGIDTDLGRANVRIRATLEQLDGDLGEARGKVDTAISRIVAGAGKSFQALGTAALGGIGVATGAITGLGAALAKVTVDAAPVQGLSDAFTGLAESAGRGTDEMLAALKKGSAGMISNRDLMMSFNQASQLVSTDFAVQLPDAMQYLSKVAAATGQDMGFMLDSLVKGVGRVSPMILDNLGIQVAQSEATERAAEMFGVEASTLDKTQIQAGLMNVVLEKLAANTASMPDVTESAAAKMARFKATIQDTKDQVGVALLPVLNNLAGTFGHLAEAVLPLLTGFIETTLAPALETVTLFFDEFVAGILAGNDPLTALQATLKEFGLEQVAEAIGTVVTRVQELWAIVQPWVEQAVTWIGQNVELQDVLIALGIAIAGVVVPAIWSLLAPALGVIAVAALLIAAVALLRKAWESDFLGIRTFVEETLAAIRAWWDEHGQQVIAIVKSLWNTITTTVTTVFNAVKEFISSVLRTIREWWEAHGEDVMTIVLAFMTFIHDTIEAILDGISSVVNAVLGAIRAFWQAHGEAIIQLARNAWNSIQTIVDTIIHTVQEIIGAVAAAIRGDWDDFGEHLKSIWQGVWDGIKTILSNAWDSLKGILQSLINSIKNKFTSANWGEMGQAIISGIVNAINAGLQAVIDAVLSLAEGALAALRRFLGIGSPSKVFAGVGEEMVAGLVRGMQRLAALPAVEIRGIAEQAITVSNAEMEQAGREVNIYVEPHYYRGDEPSLGEELRVLGLMYGVA